jgi:hypothetical protein
MTHLSEKARHKADDSVLALHRADPQAVVAAIVRTEGPAESRRAAVEAAGLVVARVFRLVPGLAVEGPVACLLELAEQPWVRSVSLDRVVHTMQDRAADSSTDESDESGSR